MANDYTSSTDAFADISEGGYSSTDPVLGPVMVNFITAASRLIDAEVGRWPGFFYPTTDSSTDFYYDGSGLGEQEIDEFVSISAVAVAEQGGVSSTNYTAWTLNTDYLTWPYNAARKGKPITKLLLDVIDGSKGGFYAYQKAVKVTGVPGYSTTPPDVVKLACKMQAIRWFMRAKQGYQDTGANVEIGQMTFKGKLELDPDVKALLWPMKLELER
jgi:hypothetical protein